MVSEPTALLLIREHGDVLRADGVVVLPRVDDHLVPEVGHHLPELDHLHRERADRHVLDDCLRVRKPDDVETH